MSTVSVVARFAVKPEHLEEAIAVVKREMVERTKGEPGCLKYDLWQDAEDPNRLAMLEEWESADALSVHLAQDWLGETVAKLMPMASEPLSVQRLQRPA